MLYGVYLSLCRPGAFLSLFNLLGGMRKDCSVNHATLVKLKYSGGTERHLHDILRQFGVCDQGFAFNTTNNFYWCDFMVISDSNSMGPRDAWHKSPHPRQAPGIYTNAAITTTTRAYHSTAGHICTARNSGLVQLRWEKRLCNL